MAHQNKVFFRKFKRPRNSFTSEMPIFGHNYTKFSYRERSSILSHSSLEYMYFKGRTEVEVGDLIFCREVFPYLESSLEFPRPRESENFVQALSAGLDSNILSDTSSQKNCTIYRRRIQDVSKKDV